MIAESSIEETAPLGEIPQGPYLNQMIALRNDARRRASCLSRLHDDRARAGGERAMRVGRPGRSISTSSASIAKPSPNPTSTCRIPSCRTVISGAASSPSCEAVNDVHDREQQGGDARASVVGAGHGEAQGTHRARDRRCSPNGRTRCTSRTTSVGRGSTPAAFTTRSRTRPTPSCARWWVTSPTSRRCSTAPLRRRASSVKARHAADFSTPFDITRSATSIGTEPGARCTWPIFSSPGAASRSAIAPFLPRRSRTTSTACFEQVVRAKLEWSLHEGHSLFPETVALWNSFR